MVLGVLISTGAAQAAETSRDPCVIRLPYEQALVAAVGEQFRAGEVTRVEVLRAERRVLDARYECGIWSETGYSEAVQANLAELVLLARREVAKGSLGPDDLTKILLEEIDFRHRYEAIESPEFCTVKLNFLNQQLAYAQDYFSAGEVTRVEILAAELEILRHRQACSNLGVELP